MSNFDKYITEAKNSSIKKNVSLEKKLVSKLKESIEKNKKNMIAKDENIYKNFVSAIDKLFTNNAVFSNMEKEILLTFTDSKTKLTTATEKAYLLNFINNELKTKNDKKAEYEKMIEFLNKAVDNRKNKANQ